MPNRSGDRPVPVGVVSTGPRVLRNRLLNVASIGAPLLAFVGGCALGPSWPTCTTAVVFVAMFLATAAGIGIGLHRLFTHRSFQTSTGMKMVLGVLGTWAFQGPISRWVADHRRHHKYSDRPGDPHSPYWHKGEASSSSIGGLLHAHLGWMMVAEVSDERIYAADILRDRGTCKLSQLYWPIALSSFVVAGLAGFIAGGAQEAFRCTLWAGALRVVLLHQVTWSVNSFGHTWQPR